MLRTLALATCVAAISLATTVRADEPWRSQLEVGDFDVFHKADSAAFDLQLRPGWRLWDFIGTFAGVMASAKGAVYGYGGFTFDLKLTDHWLITEDEAVGIYGDGSDKKLGNDVEFRSGIGVGYEFDNGWRAGVAIHHISNAGLGKRNPGVEIGAFTLAVPLFGPSH
jgi:lipid A 3-O-deacylase